MEQALPPNPTRVATKWAIISAITAVVITYIIQYLNLDPNSPVKYVGIVTFALFLILTQKEFKDLSGGYITFGKAFTTGFRYAVFTGLIMALFTFIYLKFLSPEVLDKSIEGSRAQMEQKGMSDTQIDKALSIAKNYGPIIGAVSAAIGDAIIGAVISLIGAAIIKKDPPPTYNATYTAEDYVDPTV